MIKNIIIAVVIVVIVVIILFASGVFSKQKDVQTQTQQNISTSNGSSSSGSVITYPETFEVPTETDIKQRLTSQVWNALVTTYKNPGIVTDYDQVSAKATFNYDNGTDIDMELDWMTSSDNYVMYDWNLNSSLDGYSTKYNTSTGDIHYITVVPHPTRIDISIYTNENALQRIVMLTMPE